MSADGSKLLEACSLRTLGHRAYHVKDNSHEYSVWSKISQVRSPHLEPYVVSISWKGLQDGRCMEFINVVLACLLANSLELYLASCVG
mmetsp:Transcript_56182/g.149973  ORF Transcript_56182/g.149973 Transcript_56182/m.149973 type:complete len:88 (+) Transcript_56182:1400-1663(+)